MEGRHVHILAALFGPLPQQPIKFQYIFPSPISRLLTLAFVTTQPNKLFIQLLHCDDGTGSDLHLLRAAEGDLSERIDVLLQRLAVPQNAHLPQYLRYSIIRKHCQLIDVTEVAGVLRILWALESAP